MSVTGNLLVYKVLISSRLTQPPSRNLGLKNRQLHIWEAVSQFPPVDPKTRGLLIFNNSFSELQRTAV